MTSPDYTSFRALSFDIYGTLIDWESPILSLFRPHLNSNFSDQEILDEFHAQESDLQTASPTKPYRDIAAEATKGTSRALDLKDTVSASDLKIAEWPAFPDTLDAMRRLKKHYKLIALSNIDHISITSTLTGPLKDVDFDATYIAEDIGDYKPSPKNFEYLIEHADKVFGVKKEEILMVAHGLETDHGVLAKVGMKPGVWIMRGDGEKLRKKAEALEIGARFSTLGDFADAVEWAFEEKKGQGEKETLEALEESGIGGS